jgi:hypothetical protein
VASVEALIEADTLALWADQSPVIDAAELYDQLREGLAGEYRRYREARQRGWRGQADASRSLDEILDLCALLDVIAESLTYRRGLYLNRGRVWPLAGEVTGHSW